MKISVNWITQFTDITLSTDELVAKIGAQLGEVESVVALGPKYQGIVIARIVSCEKHPNADKLSVCMIDDGGVVTDVAREENGYVQVVCGAPNVAAGMTVVWLPPGATVPSTFDAEPFVLGSRELRGVMSNGMLASAAELAISDDHSGIVAVEVPCNPGDMFAQVYQLDDTIIEIENKMFTHRPDCFGILGVAREIAGITGRQFTSPDWYQQEVDRIKPARHDMKIEILNEANDAVPRFMVVGIDGVTVRPSSLMMQTYLSRVGLRPINNIVDVTNYVMYLTGQPTHAYDYDKLRSVAGTPEHDSLVLSARMSKQGETLPLLNGKSIGMVDEKSVIIAADQRPVGLAGIMGGSETEVDAHTTRVVIECANFDMYTVRKSSMQYGLFTDAVTRFGKGQSAFQNPAVLAETALLVQAVAGGEIATKVLDAPHETVALPSVAVSASFINARLGSELTTDAIVELLSRVEFGVVRHDDHLVISVPFWRTDIAIAEDIVEEVGRLYGYDRLPQILPHRDITPVQKSDTFTLRQNIRQLLSGAGASEVLSYSFVHGRLLAATNQDNSLAFSLINALSPDLEYYRLSMTPSLLDKVHMNIKSGYDEFGLFEMGKVHAKSEIAEDGLPAEFERLAYVVSANERTNRSRETGAAYYTAKLMLEQLVPGNNLRYISFAESPIKDHAMFAQLQAPFDPGRSAVVFVGDRLLGVVGEYRETTKRALKLPQFTAGFEVFLSSLGVSGIGIRPYVPLTKYPKVTQDISLRAINTIRYHALYDELLTSIGQIMPEDVAVQLMPVTIYAPENTDSVHYSFRITLLPQQHTLQAAHVNELLDKVATILGSSLGVVRI